MGTFERIRQTSPYILGLFAVAFIAYMVLSSADINDIIRQGSNPQSAVIANINGKEIKYVDYEKKVKEEAELERKQQKDKDKDNKDAKEVEINESQISKRVWNQMTESVMINQEAQTAGINLSDDVIADILINNPPDNIKQSFSDKENRFNYAIWRDIVTKPENLAKHYKLPEEKKKEVIENFRQDIIRIEEYLKSQKSMDWLQYAVNASGSIVSPLYAKEKYLNENTKANIKYLVVGTGGMNPNDFKVSDTEIKNYYEKNKQYWPQRDQRKIKYLSYSIVPSHDDTTNALKKINNLLNVLNAATTDSAKYHAFEAKLLDLNGYVSEYKQFKDVDMAKQPILSTLPLKGVAGPVTLNDGVYFFRLDDKRAGTPTVKVSHILIQFTKDNAKSKDSAKAEAEKILKRAKAGEDFATMARTLSKDPSAAQNAGDMGYFDESKNFVAPFKKAALAANKGDVVGPIESEFGFHIIKCFDKITEEIKYSEIKITTSLSSATKNKLMRDAMSFAKQVKDGIQFDTLAKKSNKRVQESGFIDKHKPLLGSQYLGDLAFSENVGSVIEPLEIENYGYVVAQISEARNKGVVVLEDKKEEIKEKLRKQKMLDAVKAKAMDVYNKVKSYGTFEAAKAADSNLKVIDGTDFKNNGFNNGMTQRDFGFTSKVFTLPLNKINEPIKGDEAFYIVQVNSVTKPNENDVKKALPDYIKTLSGNTKNSNYFQWFQNLKLDIPFIDNRKNWYKNY